MTEITESAEIQASCFIDVDNIGVSKYYSRRKPPCFAESQETFSSLLSPDGEKRPRHWPTVLVCHGHCNKALPMWPERQKGIISQFRAQKSKTQVLAELLPSEDHEERMCFMPLGLSTTIFMLQSWHSPCVRVSVSKCPLFIRRLITLD